MTAPDPVTVLRERQQRIRAILARQPVPPLPPAEVTDGPVTSFIDPDDEYRQERADYA